MISCVMWKEFREGPKKVLLGVLIGGWLASITYIPTINIINLINRLSSRYGFMMKSLGIRVVCTY